MSRLKKFGMRTLFLTVVTVLLAAVTTTYAARYVVTQLLSPTPQSSVAKGINSSGKVAGYGTFSAYTGVTTRAYIYSNYSTMQLSAPGGTSYGMAINGGGQVAGYGLSGGYQHALLWTNGAPQDLGVLAGSFSSYAYGVNDFGTVVGSSGSYPFVWQSGVMTRLGTASGTAYSINSSGQVAGSGNSYPVIWDSLGNMTTLTTASGAAYHINDGGQAVGYYYNSGYKAFLWQGGSLQALTTPAGASSAYAYSLNGAGAVVGYGNYSLAPFNRALLWEGGTVSDLNTLIPAGSGWLLTKAWDVNATGQIVGDGTYNGKTQAFLLTPTLSPVSQAVASGTAGCSGWYTSPVTVTLTATDRSGSGIKEIHYILDGATEVVIGDVTATVAINDEGTHTLSYYAVDYAGNVEASNTMSVKIDGTVPASATSVSGIGGANGWYKSPVTVQINGSDATSGVGSIKYRKNIGGNWGSTYTAGNPAYVSFGSYSSGGANGHFSVGYYAVDLACNAETEKFQDVNIDSLPPITTYAPSIPPNANGWYTGDVTASFTATDNLSGVASISVNGVAAPGSTASTTVTTEGLNILNYFGTDLAGVDETSRSVTVGIDKTAPATAYSTSATANANGWFNADVTVNFTATDNLSGVDFLAINGANFAGSTTSSVIGEGISTVSYSATDKAGIAEGQKSVTLNVDKTAPTVTVSTSPATLGATNKSKLVPVIINGSASDPLSGIASVVITITDEYGIYNTTVSSFGSTVGLDTYKKRNDSDGRLYTIRATATDLAGNQQTSVYSLWVR